MSSTVLAFLAPNPSLPYSHLTTLSHLLTTTSFPCFSLALLPNLEEERQILTLAGSLQQASPGSSLGSCRATRHCQSIWLTVAANMLVVVTTSAPVLTWAADELFACCHGSDHDSSGKCIHTTRGEKTPLWYCVYHQAWARELYSTLPSLWECIHILVGMGKSVQESVLFLLTIVIYRLEFIRLEEGN